MNRYVAPLLAALLLLAVPHARPAPPPDAWQHLQVSAGVSAGSYLAWTWVTESRPARAGLASLTALAVGGAKEGADALGLGDASWRDMGYNLLGAVAGAALVWVLDAAFD